MLKFSVTEAGLALVDWAGTRKAYAGRYDIEIFNGGKEPVGTTHCIDDNCYYQRTSTAGSPTLSVFAHSGVIGVWRMHRLK